MNTLIQTLLRSLVSVLRERGYLQLESLALRHQGGGFKAISKTDLLRPCGSRLMASVVNLVAHVAASVARLRLGILVWMDGVARPRSGASGVLRSEWRHPFSDLVTHPARSRPSAKHRYVGASRGLTMSKDAYWVRTEDRKPFYLLFRPQEGSAAIRYTTSGVPYEMNRHLNKDD